MATRLHPLPLHFLSNFARRNQISLDWLLDCMDPEGSGIMSHGTAAEIELTSQGEVPVSSWPRLKKIDMAYDPLAPDASGRPPKTPDHALHTFVRAHNATLVAFGRLLKPVVSHQRLTNYISGRRAIPLPLSKQIEKVTKGRVPWESWVLVEDPASGSHYTFGVPIDRTKARALSKELKASTKPDDVP